ncbi:MULTISPECIES: hypothetical protein [Acinetobacter]|uniref:ApeA N-terminal domain-containing protein n=1 Tax=Acinetobacter pittii ANC 4050 TaxID=1217691 RepID=R8YPH7_ACIPI|nr:MULTISPECIES: hypothetical protein [Acinetobacter]EOQ71194.1 hypothetical protein F931_00253 [Acinetobacter pittii ANC 4050]
MINTISDKALEKIRNFTFETHCPSVKIYQKNGLILEGYGIIKINDFGTFYLEFVCLKKKNIPHIKWDLQLPSDMLDESQTCYLDATDTQGKIFKSEGFRFTLNVLSIAKTSIHHILLINLIITNPSSVSSKNYLYLEFNQSISIPRNKLNQSTSTLGTSSSSWNESIINFEKENYRIRIVNNDKDNQNFIVVEGAEDPEALIDCLAFYLGLTSGVLLQPYYSICNYNNQETITLYSTNKLYLNKKFMPAIPYSLRNDIFRDGEYHFNILRSSIQLSKEKPDIFRSIYAQWKRVWYSYNSEQDITNLTLTTAIEGLLNDIFIPILSRTKRDDKLENDINKIRAIIKDLEIEQTYKDRLMNSISYLKNITANKALSLLVDSAILKKEEIEAWKVLRNEVAHPKVKVYNLSKQYQKKENFFLCINLFNSLIFQILPYTGPINYFNASQETDILLFNYKNLEN